MVLVIQPAKHLSIRHSVQLTWTNSRSEFVLLVLPPHTMSSSTTLPEVARHSPRHASSSSSASSSPSAPSPKSNSRNPKGWKRVADRNDDRSSYHPRVPNESNPQRKTTQGLSSSKGGAAATTVGSNKSQKASFKVLLSEHQQQRVAKIEHAEREKMKKQRLHEQRRNDQREALSEEARRASKHSRMLQETYTGAMSDFSTRRVIGREAQPWDPMTKLREEARLKRATERAEKDRRSAPLRKAMDRVLRGGVEPAIPMPYFRADAL